MKMIHVSGKAHGGCSGYRYIIGGLLFLVLVMWSSDLFAVGAPLKYSPSHWLKNIPAPPPDMSVAEAVCPDIRAFPGRIDAARAEAGEIAGDEIDMEHLVSELMMRGNVSLLKEMVSIEQHRHMSGGGPQTLQRHQVFTELEELRKELGGALRHVGDGLPACYADEKSGVVDTVCIEKNNRTINERIVRAYNNYLHAVQVPLLTLRKEITRLIEMEESLIHVESRTDSQSVNNYLLHQRIGLLGAVRDYAQERGNACVYPDWQKKEAR